MRRMESGRKAVKHNDDSRQTPMTPHRQIAVLTVGRSDFTRYRPVLRALRDEPGVEMRLLVTGAHFSPRFGETWREIAEAGFPFERGPDLTAAADSPAGAGGAIGIGTAALAEAFARRRPDLLVVLGDRYEMLCGPAAALGFMIPVAHLHGGAVTEGAIDEQVRHALTKMSHYHLVSIPDYAARVRQMGEEDWRVEVVGAPGLDELPTLADLSPAALGERVGLDLSAGYVLLGFHPVTLEVKQVRPQIEAVLAAIAPLSLPVVLTYPNTDPGHHEVIAALEAFAAAHPGRAVTLANAGGRVYSSLMRHATVMVGNSSSGLVEAPSFRLPVVNVGTRQDGKLKPANILDCPPETPAIAAALARALSPDFRRSLADLVNPYGDGRSGPRIARRLATLPLDDRLLRKKFVDR